MPREEFTSFKKDVNSSRGFLPWPGVISLVSLQAYMSLTGVSITKPV